MPSVIVPQRQHQHSLGCCPQHEQPSDADLKLLEALSAPVMRFDSNRYKRRDAPMDPLLFAAATMSGPHITRHHYHHGFAPEEAELWLEEARQQQQQQQQAPVPELPSKPRYTSKQAPRRERLGSALTARDLNKENEDESAMPSPVSAALRTATATAPPPPAKRRNSVLQAATHAASTSAQQQKSPYLLAPEKSIALPTASGVEVQCLVRTRIPTAHGEVLLHLYRNNRDNKEHMAIVVDPAQLRPLDEQDEMPPLLAPPIRSQSLDARWSDSETDMDRIVRGAYVGRLSAAGSAAAPDSRQQRFSAPIAGVELPPPLVRIHSECFTGETVGSMRCDCGEQLDEAVRRIMQPVVVQTPGGPVQVPGRGVVLYLRQEGRGIGLLSKLRAYNLQDLGHDTVAANLMLGHGADERKYELAAAMLRDLGLADGVKLLTNNPDKIAALACEGINVAERVEMVPKAWRCDQGDQPLVTLRADGPRLGAHTPRGEDLERYLKTKITRMGHLLDLPSALPQNS